MGQSTIPQRMGEKAMMYAHIILISDKGRAPLSHRVEVKSVEDYKQNKIQYREKAIAQLCKSRAMAVRHLREYGYNQVTVKFEIKEG